MKMTNGAPMIDRMAFTGRVLLGMALWAMMSAASVSDAPVMEVVKMFF